MPKLRKPPKNAYYFFMVDRKKELESKGYRFPGGMKDVAGAVRQEWNTLPQDDRAYFEDLAKTAKEDEKLNFDNKFTATGESYAHVMERQAAEQERTFNIERMIDDLTICSTIPPETRNFVVIKTIHTCEVLLPRHSFLPLEITLASFNLKDGMKRNYWTLVDTIRTPIGYASASKETAEETGLPIPGSKVFQEKHRDWKKILNNIKRFIEEFLKDYDSKYVIFGMETDIQSAEGCIQWLAENADYDREERAAMNVFLNKLCFYKLPKLLLRFAIIAKRRNPNYNHVMAIYSNLEQSAVSVLREGCFDYRDDITCDYHNQDEPSIKMHVCCRNVVLRQIYLIIKEIVPGLLLPMKEGHDIEMFRKFTRRPDPVAAGIRQPPVPGPPSGTSSCSYSASALRAIEANKRDLEESEFLSDAWGKALEAEGGTADAAKARECNSESEISFSEAPFRGLSTPGVAVEFEFEPPADAARVGPEILVRSAARTVGKRKK